MNEEQFIPAGREQEYIDKEALREVVIAAGTYEEKRFEDIWTNFVLAKQRVDNPNRRNGAPCARVPDSIVFGFGDKDAE